MNHNIIAAVEASPHIIVALVYVPGSLGGQKNKYLAVRLLQRREQAYSTTVSVIRANFLSTMTYITLKFGGKEVGFRLRAAMREEGAKKNTQIVEQPLTPPDKFHP